MTPPPKTDTQAQTPDDFELALVENEKPDIFESEHSIEEDDQYKGMLNIRLQP